MPRSGKITRSGCEIRTPTTLAGESPPHGLIAMASCILPRMLSGKHRVDCDLLFESQVGHPKYLTQDPRTARTASAHGLRRYPSVTLPNCQESNSCVRPPMPSCRRTEKAGLIKFTHGRLYRKSLEAASCEYYATVKGHLDRLGLWPQSVRQPTVLNDLKAVTFAGRASVIRRACGGAA
jgi:hypothetical protein